jgi:hypothetical protein
MTTYRYPYVGITSTQTDYFQIQIYTSAADNSLTGVAPVGTSVGTIILPMPSNIQDGNSVAYGEETLSNFTAKGLDIAQTAMGTTLQEIASGDATKIQQATDNVLNLVTDPGLKSVVMKSLAAEAVSIFGGNVSINSLFARESGQIINPNMELLFSGVTLRTFRYSFKMSPRNSTEKDQIRGIIRTLKQSMSPGQSGGDNDFLSVPNIFQPKFMKGAGLHPFLHRFKTCFLKDMSVNYTAENTYATYGDGTPISMTMDLTFQEREPIYASDYTTGDGAGAVGY